MALLAGVRLGHYEILELIGVGGMGEVYRAHDPRLNRDVAVKTLPMRVAADPHRLVRFTRKAHVPVKAELAWRGRREGSRSSLVRGAPARRFANRSPSRRGLERL